jgi:hypothetical protein
LVRDLIRKAKENGIKDKVITDLLNQRTKYHGLSWRPRLNKEIIEGRFDIDEIIRIERKMMNIIFQTKHLISHLEQLHNY